MINIDMNGVCGHPRRRSERAPLLLYTPSFGWYLRTFGMVDGGSSAKCLLKWLQDANNTGSNDCVSARGGATAPEVFSHVSLKRCWSPCALHADRKGSMSTSDTNERR